MATSARRLLITNPRLSDSQRTYLSSDYTAGTSLELENTSSWAINQIAVVGEPGAEKTESKPVSAITDADTVAVTGALSFAHRKATVVYQAEYDQVEVSAYSGSSWSVLATISIQWDQIYTTYVHSGGTNSNSYRFRFKNSASSDFSEYGPTVGGAGFSEDSIGQRVINVRRVIKDPHGVKVSTEEIIRFLTRAKNIIRARRNDWWFWKNESEGDITTVAGTNKYDLDTISERIDYVIDVRFNYTVGNNNSLYPIGFLPNILFDQLVIDNNRQNDDSVASYTLLPGDSNSTSGYIKAFPTPKTTGEGSFYIRWQENEADYDDISDTTKIALPDVLEDYAIFRCLQIMGEETKAGVYKDLFFGPPADRRDNEDLSGIALLEQMQGSKGRPTKQARSLKRFVGNRTRSQFYGPRYTSVDQVRQDYW